MFDWSVFTPEVVEMIKTAIWETLYMTLMSTAMGYVIGLPMGVALAVSSEKGIMPNKAVYGVLDFVVNIIRSAPFLILLMLVSPITKLIVGKSYGPSATIVPLVIAAAPFIARMVESSIQEVDKGVVEAAQSMGASNFDIITRVLIVEARTSLIVGVTIAIGTILGYSAMAGIVGGGGLGDVAIRYGYYRYQTEIMVVTVLILIVLVQIMQAIGMALSRVIDKRRIK
jgi:D-methionine transport system permease protein